MKKLLILLTIPILLTSCQNPYKAHYKHFAIYNWQNMEFYIGEPQAINSADMMTDVANYRRKGYGVIGYSDFSGETMKNLETKMKKFAKEIGAEIIVWNQVLAGSETRQFYLRTQYYSGWQTYVVNKINYGSVFLSKLKDIGVGIFTRDLTGDEKSQKHVSHGAYIGAITEEGPASKAGLLEGDIIIRVNEKNIEESRDFESIDLEGMRSLRIRYVRDGRKRDIIVTLGLVKTKNL